MCCGISCVTVHFFLTLTFMIVQMLCNNILFPILPPQTIVFPFHKVQNNKLNCVLKLLKFKTTFVFGKIYHIFLYKYHFCLFCVCEWMCVSVCVCKREKENMRRKKLFAVLFLFESRNKNSSSYIFDSFSTQSINIHFHSVS